MLRTLRIAVLSLGLGLGAGPLLAEMRLLMVEQPGCPYCRLWDREIGGVYHLTDIGQAAPLLRTRLREALPEGVTLARPAAFTPIFVLLRGGEEVGRINGYPGEDFFWGLLERMLAEAGP